MLRYVYCFLLFFLFRIVRIRRRRKVHVRYISSVMSFLFSLW